MSTLRHRRGGLAVAAMTTALVLSACGVSVEGQEPEVEPAGDAGPVATADTTEQAGGEDTVVGTAPADTTTVTADPHDAASRTAAPDDTAGAAVPVLYAGPAAGSPEVAALGTLIQTPVESCLALYRDAVPEGAYLEPEPDVQNTESDLSLRCTMLSQAATALFTGEVRIMPDQRHDQEVVVENSDESMQRGHLRSEIYPISDSHPDNHLSTITHVLDRVGTLSIEPFSEQAPPAGLADDLPTSYTQPGRNSEEVIRLYRLLKDPYAGCQHLLDGALPDGARIEDNPMTQDSATQLTLWCTVEAPGGLLFVAARSVVHPQTDSGVTEALTGDDVGWQDGFVLMTAEVSGAAVDPADLLPAMHANLRTDP